MSDFEKYRKRMERVRELEALRDAVSRLVASLEIGRDSQVLLEDVKNRLKRVDSLTPPHETEVKRPNE